MAFRGKTQALSDGLGQAATTTVGTVPREKRIDRLGSGGGGGDVHQGLMAETGRKRWFLDKFVSIGPIGRTPDRPRP